MFNFSKENWKSVYINKIKNIYDKNMCEFNYKLLNDMLSSNSILRQCMFRPNNCCDYCQDTAENIDHLIFERNMVNTLKSFAIYIMWKHINSTFL